jgi:hypothetical protein
MTSGCRSGRGSIKSPRSLSRIQVCLSVLSLTIGRIRSFLQSPTFTTLHSLPHLRLGTTLSDWMLCLRNQLYPQQITIPVSSSRNYKSRLKHHISPPDSHIDSPKCLPKPPPPPQLRHSPPSQPPPLSPSLPPPLPQNKTPPPSPSPANCSSPKNQPTLPSSRASSASAPGPTPSRKSS